MPPRLTAGQGNAIGAAIRSFRRSKNQWNNSSKKIRNSARKLITISRRIRNNNPNLVAGQGGAWVPGQNMFRPMYNAIRTLPARGPNGYPVARSNNMKYFIKMYNNHHQLVQNVHRNKQAFLTAARNVIRTSTNPRHITLLNLTRGNLGGNNRLEHMARNVINAHELEKGRMIRNIVKERMASPRTAIGKRLIMGRMPKN